MDFDNYMDEMGYYLFKKQFIYPLLNLCAIIDEQADDFPGRYFKRSIYLNRVRKMLKPILDKIDHHELEKFLSEPSPFLLKSETTKHTNIDKTKNKVRHPNLDRRFKVMKRDNFACKTCGASPAKSHGIELHVDHIIPISKGGGNSMDNLQTLCSDCNLGKGARH